MAGENYGLDSSADKLLVAVRGDAACVCVVGRGSFKLSTSLKNFVRTALSHGSVQVVIDMQACIGMDSTFMGVLAGLAGRLKKFDTKPTLVNLSSKNKNLLSTLGLDLLVENYSVGELPTKYASLFDGQEELSPLTAGQEKRRDTAATMLEAHEKLVEVSPDNLDKFKDVIHFLRDDLEKT